MKRPLSPPGRIAAVVLALLLAMPLARAEDLMQIFRDAERNDPTLAAARAQWEATQEKVPQARSTLLPNVSAAVSANANQYNAKFFSDPSVSVNRGFGFGSGTISATQPLYRYGNQVAYEQAKQQVEQSDFNLASARQDLVLRVAEAYFDVLLAQFNVELAESQLAAVNEQLAQAKRNFEVGVATITDTNDAQAKHDQIVAQQIAAQNDLDNKRTALRVIIGRQPGDLRRLGRGFDPPSPSPNDQDYWIGRALAENLQVRVAQYSFDIATLEVDRQRAGHLPTLDLVGSFNAQGANASPTSPVQQSSTQALI
ncbi:MAG TPA: TolC family protein, partial [Casimicrobiaceae bacterium]|nr:TolC family protein [Casimicrobiaceae bacterium]